jgi:chaperonin cofactor prefoldin
MGVTKQAVPEKAASKLNPLQVVESEIANFITQRDQTAANLNALNGAIQASQHIYAKLKAEAEKVEEVE